MPKQYQLHLKGFVGGYDFDADYVDYVLARHEGKEVCVLIDSFGGQVNTALSISSAFHRHGQVHAHFVGMNASAATIASLGAKRITIDKSAMYLVHKCSTAFFKWGSLNADDLTTLINNLQKQRSDLDKLDANIAAMYAEKCKKEATALLDLMRQGGWLTAQEALEWGFVDEITDFAEDAAPVLTDEQATALAAANIPIPAIPKPQEAKAFTKFLQSLTQFFAPTQSANTSQPQTSEPQDLKPSNPHNLETSEPQDLITSQPHNLEPSNPQTHTMNKFFKHICDILGCKEVRTHDSTITFSDADIDTIEAALEARDKEIHDLSAKVTEQETQVNDLTRQLDEAKRKPAADTTSVVDTHKPAPQEPTEAEKYLQTRASNRALYDALP